MTDLQPRPIATANGLSITLADCLRLLHRQGRLRGIALQALADKVAAEAAQQAGLAISPEELQQAANRFRQQNGLNSAERTHQWLAWQGWTVLDFEATVEHRLLVEKFKDHLAHDRVASKFDADNPHYTRARLRLIVTAREDLARELLNQVCDDRCDFAELARQHSLHPSRIDGGNLGVIFRGQLPPTVADAVFAAQPGSVVGPLATEQGFCLYRVEALLPAELNEGTSAHIRRELFAAWLAEQLRSARLAMPLLEMLE